MKACEEYVALMMLCIDGEASREELDSLYVHLEKCDACRALFESYLAIDEAVKGVKPEPPEQLHAAIMNNIHREKVQNQPKGWLKRYRFTAMAAVAAVIVLVAAKSGTKPAFRFDTFGAESAQTAAAAEAAVPAEFGMSAGSNTVTAESQMIEAKIQGAMPEENAVAEDEAVTEAAEAIEETETACDTSAQAAGVAPEVPAEVPSIDFSEEQIQAMDEAGFCGIAACVMDMEPNQICTLFPEAQEILLATGETVFQVDAELVDTAVTAGEIEFSSTYALNAVETERIYWIFFNK